MIFRTHFCPGAAQSATHEDLDVAMLCEILRISSDQVTRKNATG
jgi:hypothetical protein